jgi:LysR family glycine cleavage system transcriptional activator
MNRMLPGTRALRTFEAAARHLNFTRAADEVGLTPAAVSYQIKEIEDQLGIVLFTRTSRSIQLTPAGAELFEATAAALSDLHRAAGRARRMSRDASGLRISTSASPTNCATSTPTTSTRRSASAPVTTRIHDRSACSIP